MTSDQGKGGRPVDYTKELGEAICERLVDDESLRAICTGTDMPDHATVHRWLACHREFREQYAFAREFQADDLYDQILEIVDDSSGDRVDLARCQLRSEVREWVADRLRTLGNGSSALKPK